MSPTSTSAKVLAGTVKVKMLPSVADWSPIGSASVGASFTATTCTSRVAARLGPLPSSTTKASERVAVLGLWLLFEKLTDRSAAW